ncbi:MAG: type II secretion system protein M [Deltaproteobacteria bacterium]
MKRKSKLLMLSIPLIIMMAGLVIYEYGISDIYRKSDELRDQYDVKMKILEKYAVLIARKPSLEQKIIELRETRKSAESKMIASPSAAVASANLQNSVKGIITGRGGVINSERVEKTEEQGKFKIISVAVDAVFPDVRVLSDALLAIETQTPYLVVKEVDVRVRNYSDPRELIVKLKVAALAGQ